VVDDADVSTSADPGTAAEPGPTPEDAPAQAPAPPRRARVIRRLIRDVSSVLIISGLLLVLDAGVTLLWQEPVTAVIAMIKRSEVNKTYLSFRTAPLTPVERHTLAKLPDLTQRIAYLARREQHKVPNGAAIGKIVIPKIGASFDVVQGTDEGDLEKGPGHYPGTAYPGLGHTVAIAGHRTTYLAPFRHIDALKPGDQIVLNMPYGRFTYVVQFHRIVLPTALWVTHNMGYERLVLSACNPLYSAAQRIIVFARLRSVVPTAAVRSLKRT
jgi:sortase A